MHTEGVLETWPYKTVIGFPFVFICNAHIENDIVNFLLFISDI